MQQLCKRKIDDSFIGSRIEYLYEFDMFGEVNMKEISWCVSVVEKISDGTWFSRVNAVNVTKKTRHNCFWDAAPEADYPASRSIETYDKKEME